ncbi:MAG: Large transcriptional regulator [Thermoleophilia bacterium]|nr:Large transcriptional regulator [Thermoleophilia bacterium]
MTDRQHLTRDAATFLSTRGVRPRAVVVTGTSGIGKTTFLDQLQVEVLAAGRTDHLVVVDDAHLLDAAAVTALRNRIESDTRTCVLIAHDGSANAVLQVIDRTCERRVIEIPRLTEDAARSLLTELGLQPWTFQAQSILASAAGNPRELVDRSFSNLDVDSIGERDTSFDGSAWSGLAAERIRLTTSGDSDGLDAFVAALESMATSDGDANDVADALSTLAELALIDGDLETAIQHGERCSATDGADDRIRILGASHASSARALRGEPTAMLSLHALAGRASRGGLPLVEAYVWYGISFAAGVLGDVATSERAAIRCIQIYDREQALTLAMRARLVLADLHVAAGRPGSAQAYFSELRELSTRLGLHRFRINVTINEARASILLGDTERACTLADETLELVMRSVVSRMDVVNAAVIAARAYSAGGSIDLALAPIEALASDLGDSHTPDFWLVLEAVRVLGASGSDPVAFQRWLACMAEFDSDGHGGALRAAHAEVDAWRVAIDGRRAEAARLAERARQLWVTAECHDELPLTDVLIQQAPMELGPRISLVGSTTPGATEPAADPDAFEVLTKREREIARYVAGGLTNPEIASELHLSPRTVEHHVASILRKLELPSRRALVRGRV